MPEKPPGSRLNPATGRSPISVSMSDPGCTFHSIPEEDIEAGKYIGRNSNMNSKNNARGHIKRAGKFDREPLKKIHCMKIRILLENGMSTIKSGFNERFRNNFPP